MVGTSSPAGANRIAPSNGSGTASADSPTVAAPSWAANSRFPAPRVRTCTRRPWAIAIWAVRCALPPNP